MNEPCRLCKDRTQCDRAHRRASHPKDEEALLGAKDLRNRDHFDPCADGSVQLLLFGVSRSGWVPLEDSSDIEE